MKRPGAVQGRGEDQRKKKEKNAGNFKPQDSADAPEGAQKASDAVRNSACGLSRGLAGTSRLGGRRSCRCACVLAGCGLGAGYSLACNATGDAESDAEGAANGLRFHFDFDGN